MSDDDVTRVLEAGDLIGRYPRDPTDQTTDGLIEGTFGLAVRGEDVYVLDAVAGSILRFDLEARLVERVGRRGQGPGELSAPTSIAAGPRGELWVGDPAANRLTRFVRASPGAFETLSPAYPPVNVGLSPGGVPVVPTMSAMTLLARVTSDGVRDLAVDPAAVPTEVSSGPLDRMSMRGLMLARLDDTSMAMLQNRHGTEFRLWRVRLSAAEDSISGIEPLPLPRWLYTILEEETEAVRRTVPAEFAEGDFLIPFKGMHANRGRLWLVPTPSSRIIALAVDGSGPMTAVVGGPGITGGLLDAAVVEERLIALYETELRVYRLDERRGAFEP
ncbi:MAG: hypothetical protein R3195_07585 [Gemmatimonadota bacterium]|nr:hypothetical protein [Gemmatimonadota bacterium]